MSNNPMPELTWKEFRQIDYVTGGAFQLSLAHTQEPFICEEIVRVLPGKRLVAFGRWGNAEVVAKLFYARGNAKRHLQQDVAGMKALYQANIPAPPLLYKGSAVKQRIQVVLFEKITPARNLAAIWQEQKNSDEFAALMHSVVIELATQHVLGILQRDLHFKNFLVDDRRIYTLDGGSIQQFPAILDKKHSLDNLSLLFAQLGPGTEFLQCALFKTYAKSRGWAVKEADFTAMQEAVIYKNKQRWQHYQKKIFRSCTAFVRMNPFGKSIMYDRAYQSTEFLDFLCNPEKIFTQPNVVLLKKGRSATVAKVMIDNRLLVVKRYNVKNSWHWLRRCLRVTRAATSWGLAQRLQLFGIATAKPVAYIEQHFLGLHGKSYFVMEYTAGQEAGEFFSAYRADDLRFNKSAEKVASLFKNLKELHLTHGDLKKTNILIKNEDPILLDLDGMCEHRTSSRLQRAFNQEMQRFMKNWKNNPSVYALFDRLINNI